MDSPKAIDSKIWAVQAKCEGVWSMCTSAGTRQLALFRSRTSARNERHFLKQFGLPLRIVRVKAFEVDK